MRLLFLTLLVFFAVDAQARPISYADGWTLMQRYNWEKSRVHLHYSPNVRNSFGVSAEDFNANQEYNLNLQWNYLLKRRNRKNSQANLYTHSEVGLAAKGNQQEPHLRLKLSGDWETRRHFAAFSTSVRYADQIEDAALHHGLRFGIAPYVAEYGALHTWLMLQIENHPEENEEDNRLIVTPIIRFFKGDYLGEIGVNENGDALFNLAIRY